MDDIAVGDDFFQQRVISRAVSAASNGTQGNGGGTVTSSPVKVKIGGAKRRASSSRAASRKKSRSSAYDSEDTSEEDADEYEEEEEELDEKPARGRRASGASLSRRNSSGLPPLPPLPPAHNTFHNFNMLYGGDASATIRITSQSSGSLPPHKASSVPYGPFSDPFLALANFPQQIANPTSMPAYQHEAQWQGGLLSLPNIPSMPTEVQATLPISAADDLDNWAEFDFAFLHEMAGAEAANPQLAKVANSAAAVATTAAGSRARTATPPHPKAAVNIPNSAPSTHLPPNPQRSTLPPASDVTVPPLKVSTALKAAAPEAPGLTSTPFKLLTSPGDAFAPGLLPPSTGNGKYDLEALNFFSSLIADAPHPCGLNLESSPFANPTREEGNPSLVPASAAKGVRPSPAPSRTFFSPALQLPRASSPDLSGLPPGSPLSSGDAAEA